MFPSLLSSIPIVAQTDSQTNWLDFKTALLIVVTVALFTVTRKLVSLHRRLEALDTAYPFPPENSDKTKPEPIAPETVAAISAAVHTPLNSRLRILSVGQICPHRQAWSAEGRRQEFSSHKVR